MAPRIDTSGLFQQAQPTPMSQGLQGLGGILEAMMERKRRQQEFEAEQAAKAKELAFRQGQEVRLANRQAAMDKRDEAREAAQAQRETQGQRIKGYEAVSKAKTPQERAFLAQLYGGTVEQAKPDLEGVDFLQNVEEDESSPLGFSYGINPEHERRTQEAARTQVMTMPGGQPISLPAPEQEEDIYEGARQAMGMYPPGSSQQLDLMRQIELSKRLKLDAKGTYGAINDVQQRQASERNARIMAARQEQMANRQDARERGREDNKDRETLQALEKRAKDADRELAIQEEIITRNNGVPVAGKDRKLYDQSQARWAGAQGLVESGNPGAEISGQKEEAIRKRTGAGQLSALGARVGIPTGATKDNALAAIRAERQALREKMADHARTYGQPAPQIGGSAQGQYGPVTTKTTKKGEQVRVRKNLSTGQWEEAP